MRAQGLGMDGIGTKARGLCPAVNCVFYLVAECTTWWVTLFFSFLFFFVRVILCGELGGNSREKRNMPFCDELLQFISWFDALSWLFYVVS